jgi:hypothetical protein
MITLVAGQKLKDITLELTPHAVVTGRVLDEDGQPLANVTIRILRYAYYGGQRQFGPAGTASTNDLGEYRLFGAPAGRYYLSATYAQQAIYMGAVDRNAQGQAGQDEGYAPLYYPGTLDPASASMVELVAGSELRGIDFTLTPVRTVRVRGRLVCEVPGVDPRQSALLLMPRSQRGVFFTQGMGRVQDDKGTFELRGVVPGSYTLIAQLFADQKRYSASLPVEVGSANIDGLTVTLAPGIGLSGQIKVEGGAETKLESIYASLQSETPFFGGPGSQVQTDGTFTMKDVAPADYRVNVTGLPENLYLKSARYGDREVLDSGLDLSKDAGGGRLEIVVSSSGGQIEGTVTDSEQKPAINATVALVPESGKRDKTYLFKNATADQSGRFTLRGVAPGEYKLFAWEEVEPGAWQDPEFLKTQDKKGEPVSVSENGRSSAQLTLIPAEHKSQEGK